MKLTRCLTALAAAAALSATFAASAREYSVSTVLSDAFPWGQAAQKWADLVEERSNGEITLRVYPMRNWSPVTRPRNFPPCAPA